MQSSLPLISPVFLFNDTATTEIYTLSLHDALPIWPSAVLKSRMSRRKWGLPSRELRRGNFASTRSEEHTSELQSLRHLVCRLLLEKKKSRSRSNRPTGRSETLHNSVRRPGRAPSSL